MKRNRFLALGLLTCALAPSLSACKSGDSALIIRVLNSEDYIYLHDPKNGYDEADLTEQFEQYIADDPELSAKYGKVKVVYNTADTMENIYSEMQTGKTSYDLICASDYIVAKMARYDLIKPIDKELVPNYFGDEENPAKSSKALTSRLDDIIIKNQNGETPLGDFTVGYMWGTLGILFNPSYFDETKEGYDVDTIIEDMADINVLWDEKYKNTISIKDSMRDTFAFGLMKAYEEEYFDKDGNSYPGFAPMRDAYYRDHTYSKKQYNAEFSKLFNYVIGENSDSGKVIDDVVKELNSLKKNIFGLEVDSGKQDIVTGKIGVNMAWSGDAVYSMEQAEDRKQVSNPHELYYSIPETGSNLWMDCWVAPKLSNQTDLQWELAHEFLNYLCDPEIAVKNMNYTGYTSFIAGDAMIDLVRDWYDSRNYEIFNVIKDEEGEEVFYDIFAVDPSIDFAKIEDEDKIIDILNDADETGVSKLLSYDDAVDKDGEGHDATLDDYLLYYAECEYDEETELVTAVNLLEPLYLTDEEGEAIVDEEEKKIQKKYGDLVLFDTAVDEDGEPLYEVVDLSYFFEGTLEEYGVKDMLFYSDEYTYYAIEDEDAGYTKEICVGRYFYTQYPDEDTLARCAVMEDYVKGNEDLNPLIMKMWENFKSDPLPIWAIVLFIMIVAILLGGFGYLFISKYLNRKLRARRKAEQR